MIARINRREAITLLGGAAAWPLSARAQQGDRVRRIGVLMPLDENDPLWKIFVSAFIQALPGLGRTDGRKVRTDLRWGRALAQELVGLQPDIILTGGNLATAAVQRETRTIPIVFVNRRQRRRPATQPTGREHHRLRQLGGLAGRQVA